MKKVILSLAGFLLLIGALVFYSEFRTVNFVHAFLSNPEELADKVQRITIWGEGDSGSNQSLVILNKENENFDEVLAAISEWEVKRTLFNDIDLTKKTYSVDFTPPSNPLDGLSVLITPDEMLIIHSKEYKLVSGPSIEELIDIAK